MQAEAIMVTGYCEWCGDPVPCESKDGRIRTRKFCCKGCKETYYAVRYGWLDQLWDTIMRGSAG